LRLQVSIPRCVFFKERGSGKLTFPASSFNLADLAGEPLSASRFAEEKIMSTWRQGIVAAAWVCLIAGTACDSKDRKPAAPATAGAEKQAGADAGAPASSKLPPGLSEEDARILKELPDVTRLSQMYTEMEKLPKVLEPVDAKKLQDLLPDALPDMGRTQFEARAENYLGQSTPTAHARYEGKGDAGKTKIIDVSLSDWGIPTSNMPVWAHRFAGPIAKESDEGFEKNFDKDGSRFYEKYTRKDHHRVLEALVTDRFLVKIEGQEAPADEVQGVIPKIDLKKLEAMKTMGLEAKSETAK
jgi:hypothetical protein